MLLFYILNFHWFWCKMTERVDISWSVFVLKKKLKSFYLQDIRHRILTETSVQTGYIQYLPGVISISHFIEGKIQCNPSAVCIHTYNKNMLEQI